MTALLEIDDLRAGQTTPLAAARALLPSRGKQIHDNIALHDSRVAATYLGGHA